MNEEAKSGTSLSTWILLAIILFVIWGVIAPQSHRRNPSLADLRKAVSNARMIGFALDAFEKEYGGFPDETTAAKVRLKTGTQLDLGQASSNDCFRQLIAAGMVTSEAAFYAKTEFTRSPNPRIEQGDEVLAPGEVGFGYLMNGASALTKEGNPSRVLLCAPLEFDGKTVSGQTFDYSMYDARAVVLRIDNSVTSLPLLKTSKLAAMGGGKFLLDTGPGTVWGDSAKPVIVPPLPKP